MACDIKNKTFTDVSNDIKNGINPYEPSIDQSAETTKEFLEHTMSTITQVDTGDKDNAGESIKKYGFIQTGNVAFNKRVTDAVNKLFVKKVGKEKAEQINQMPDNRKKASAGTFLHNAAQNIANAIIGGKSVADVKKEFTSSKYIHALKPEDFDNLHKGVEAIIKQINETQAEINARTGTDGKATIYTEQIVIDPTKDMAGSIDILALYSDNTASIFDFKSMIPASKFKIKGSNRIVEEFIPFYKVESFKLQQFQYKRILEDIYGVKQVRQTRIVPIQMELQKLPTTKRDYEKGDTYTDKITKVAIGVDQNEFLEQIVLGFEDTGYAGINELVTKNLELIKNLEAQKNKKGLNKKEWWDIQNKIQALTKATSNIILKGDFTDFYSNIITNIKEFNRRIKQEEFLPDGTENPQYLNIEDLRTLSSEFHVYHSALRHTIQYLKDLNKENPEVFSKLNNLIQSNQANIEMTRAMIDETLTERGLEKVDSRYKDEYGRLIPVKEEGYLNKLFGTLSEFAHPIFKEFRRLKDIALNKKRMAFLKVKEELEQKQIALFEWGRSQGLSKMDTYMKLVNIKTGNLISTFNDDFWEKNNKAFGSDTNENYNWIREHYEVRDPKKWKEDYKRRLEEEKEKLKASLHNLEDWKDGDTIIRSAAYHKKIYETRIQAWERENNLEGKEAWFNQRNRYYLDLKESVKEKYYSAEYKYILANKPLHDFYNMFVEYNKEFRSILGLKYGQLPNNFLPNIRKDAAEKLIRGDAGSLLNVQNTLNELIDDLAIREEDVYMGARDENGELIKNIPILFLNKLKDADGKFSSPSDKSYDLGRSLLLFANTAYNHKYMSEIEGSVYALQQTLINSKEVLTTASGKTLKDSAFNRVYTNLKPESDTVQLFNKFVDYYLYGIKFSEKDKTFNLFGKDISTKKAIMKLKQFFSTKALGFAVIPGVAAGIHGRVNIFLEATKGIAFTREQEAETMMDHLQQSAKWDAVAHFFDTYTEGIEQATIAKASGSFLLRNLTTRTLFTPLRRPDERIDNFITVAMSKNYGIDKNGNIKRMPNLLKTEPNAKSLWDSITFDEKTKKIKIEGITESAYIGFRNAVKTTARGIKGAMSSDDINQADLNMLLNVSMQFKTWMPGVLKEKFKGLKYNEILDAVEYGRFSAYFSEYEYLQGEGFRVWMTDAVIPAIGKLIVDLPTFGFLHETLNPINERRAKLYYEKWKLENPIDAINVSYEDFLMIKKAQIRTLMNELRIAMILSSLVMAMMMGAGDDDKKKTGEEASSYKSSIIGRNLFRLFNKTESEMLFTMNPSEFMRLFKNPIPLLTLLTDLQKTLYNTFDEGRDLLFGENSPQDRTALGHYTTQWIPGVSQLRRVIDIMFEEDKRRKY